MTRIQVTEDVDLLVDWRIFLTAHRLEASISRRGRCHDKAVIESFLLASKAQAYQTQDLCN